MRITRFAKRYLGRLTCWWNSVECAKREMYLVIELWGGDPGELDMGTTIDEYAKNYYLRCLYFGNLDDPVGTAIRRSYRDFNRTLRGFARVANSDEIRVRARETLRDGLTALKSASIAGQDEFDNWHRELCARLSSDFEAFHFTVGHGQKWINMSIKYLFLLRPSDVEQYWKFCHVPTDRIVGQAASPGFSSPTTFLIKREMSVTFSVITAPISTT